MHNFIDKSSKMKMAELMLLIADNEPVMASVCGVQWGNIW